MKVSVVLFKRQIIHLDRLLTDIRAKTKSALNRAVIIRALLDAVIESRLDLTKIKSEAELRTCIRRSLRR